MRIRILLLWFTLLSGTISASSAEDFRSYIRNSWDFHRVPQPPAILQSKRWNHWVLMPWRYRWGKEYNRELAQRLKEAGFNGAMCDHNPQKAKIHEQAGLLWYLDHAAGKGDLYLYPEDATQEARRAPNRPVCLADPQVWDRLRGRLAESLEDSRDYYTRIAYALDDEVSRLHTDALVVDTHCDTLKCLSPRFTLPRDSMWDDRSVLGLGKRSHLGHVDIPRLMEGEDSSIPHEDRIGDDRGLL